MGVHTGRRGSLSATLLVGALGSLVAAWWSLELWRVTDWRIPLSWERGGDALFITLLVETVQETGWYLEHPRLGAPSGMELYDWPGTILLPILAMKVFGWVLAEPGAILNLYYLLSWPLTGLAAAWGLLELGVRPPFAGALGILYAALPSHALRGEPHLFLTALFFIPPLIVCAARLSGAGWTARWRTAALLLGLVVGASDAYYAFFGAFFVATAGGIAWCSGRGWRRLLDACSFCLATAFGLLAAIAPTLLRGDRSVVERAARDAEILGLKLVQLVLPIPGHRFPPFDRLVSRYSQLGSAPGLVNENSVAALGVVGTVGLALLLGRMLGARWAGVGNFTALNLARLCVAGIMLATVGGFGAAFATLVSPQIRAYNRISVFVGFLGLAAMGLLLTRCASPPRSGRGAAATYLAAACLATVGVWDQSSTLAVPRYEANLAAWTTDREWVARLEANLPPGTMLFQLPYVAFPESTPRHRLFNWDPLRPILHSRTLRWSYGAMKHRDTDLWQRSVAALPPAQMRSELIRAGFRYLVVDVWGYESVEDPTLQSLIEHLGAPVLSSRDGRWRVLTLDGDRAPASSLAGTAGSRSPTPGASRRRQL